MSGRTTRRLRGTEMPLSEETYGQVAWLLRKYTSFTYGERMWRLYASFLVGYQAYAKTRGPIAAGWYMETFARLYQYQAWLEEGLRLVRRGDRSGYGAIHRGVDFAYYLTCRRFDSEDFAPLGMRNSPRPPEGLYAWAYGAILMADRLTTTLSLEWTFERILGIEWAYEQQFAGYPESLRPAAIPPLVRHRSVVFLRRDQETPITGIWQPTRVGKGCPNFILAGATCPDVLVPYERIDDPAFPGGDGTPPSGPRTFFKYNKKPTEWRLAWEDRRYLDGTIPSEEAEYLKDPHARFPNGAIEAVPPLT